MNMSSLIVLNKRIEMKVSLKMTISKQMFEVAYLLWNAKRRSCPRMPRDLPEKAFRHS